MAFFSSVSAPFRGSMGKIGSIVQTCDEISVGTRLVTDRVLRTVVAEVAALLNSRPLTHLSMDPDDPDPLTPNHFLNGGARPYTPLKKRWCVALLVKKDLQMARIPVKQFLKSKIVDVSVTISTKTKIYIYSIYCPDGNESILNLLHYLSGRTNHCIIGGDFNGHSPRWFNSHLSNKIGREISNFLTNSDNFTLLTPKNLPTRIDSVTMKKSTLDLTIMSTQLALCSSIKLGPYLGSDHLPIVFRLLTKEKIIKQKIQLKWKFKEKEWPKWNESITRKLAEKKYMESGNPKLAFSIFHESVLES
ncbi:Uncharacterized protein APZ42_028048 [Daphnia magna]|uniref:Endonuclease/exonuclease/phosphatase domain-containing protein n=1 Tax=Daphnia magna TaxID=35525 RepID=A0A164QVC3_9CRUS|nr:Uncharacterized protein APZ42_028048 [Daphnia magna]